MKVLVCDKTEKECIEEMRAAGLTVDTNFEITPEDLMTTLPAYDVAVVRSRTKIRQPLIDVCPDLKLIVRGGVGVLQPARAVDKGVLVSARLDQLEGRSGDRRLLGAGQLTLFLLYALGARHPAQPRDPPDQLPLR